MKPVRSMILLAALSWTGVACTEKKNDQPAMGQRERDSAIAEWRVPGAGGVGRALRATDSINARRAREAAIH